MNTDQNLLHLARYCVVGVTALLGVWAFAIATFIRLGFDIGQTCLPNTYPT